MGYRQLVDRAFDTADREGLGHISPSRVELTYVSTTPAGEDVNDVVIDIAGRHYSSRGDSQRVPIRIGRTKKVNFGVTRVHEYDTGEVQVHTSELGAYYSAHPRVAL